jgi:putative DNA methylase
VLCAKAASSPFTQPFTDRLLIVIAGIKQTKKLIEVTLPLDAINKAAKEEKSVPRRGHPQTLHYWWARRPLAVARGVIFAQMVDDPSSHP